MKPRILFSTTDVDEIAKHYLKLRIPEDIKSSFKEGNNDLKWRIVFKIFMSKKILINYGYFIEILPKSNEDCPDKVIDFEIPDLEF